MGRQELAVAWRAVHLLLPSSTGADGRGRPLAQLVDGPLAQARAPRAALHTSSRPPDTAAAALLLPPGVAAAAIRTNAAVLDAPTMPALRRYAGTVYAGLDAASLEPRHAAHSPSAACSSSAGCSASCAGTNRCPTTGCRPRRRCPASAPRRRSGGRCCATVMPALLARGLVVDLRSADYAAMWRPPAQLRSAGGERAGAVPLPGGGYGMISYAEQAGEGPARPRARRARRGRPARRDADDVRAAWRACGGVGRAAHRHRSRPLHRLTRHDRDTRRTPTTAVHPSADPDMPPRIRWVTMTACDWTISPTSPAARVSAPAPNGSAAGSARGSVTAASTRPSAPATSCCRWPRAATSRSSPHSTTRRPTGHRSAGRSRRAVRPAAAGSRGPSRVDDLAPARGSACAARPPPGTGTGPTASTCGGGRSASTTWPRTRSCRSSSNGRSTRSTTRRPAGPDVRLRRIEIAGDEQTVDAYLGAPSSQPLDGIDVDWIAPSDGETGVLAAVFDTPRGEVRID